MLIRFTGTGHAFMLYYVAASLSYALDVAGILTLVEVWHWARPRLAVRGLQVRLVAVTLVSLLVGTTAYSAYVAWAPAPRGIKDNVTNPVTAYSMSMLAHAQRLPSGRPGPLPGAGLTAGVPDRPGRVLRAQHARRARSDPDVISDNQALFAFTGWRDWLMPDRVAASGLTRWDYRHGLLRRLAGTTDPASMASGPAAPGVRAARRAGPQGPAGRGDLDLRRPRLRPAGVRRTAVPRLRADPGLRRGDPPLSG